MLSSRVLAACCACVLLAGCAGPRGGDGAAAGHFDIGPLVTRDTDLHGDERLRMLGPFVHWQRGSEDKTFRAIRPLWNRASDPVRDRTLTEILWPLGMFKNYRGESYWRVLLGFGHDFDTEASGSRYRFVVFPILYAGIDAHDKGYFGVFPIAGKVNEFLGRDRIYFFAFPLYMYTSIHDVETHDVLWPFISWSHGEGVSRYRVFPFYLRSEREGQWVRSAVMWPFWTSVRSTDPERPGGGWLLFPLCGHAQLGENEKWWVIPPFFKYERLGEDKTVYCPYPFFQYSSGTVDKLYIWPLWGRKSTEAGKSSFLLWPICSTESVERTRYTQRRFRLVPLIYYQSRTAKAAVPDTSEERPAQPMEGEVTERYFKLWPLFSYRREGNEARLRTLDLWPAKHTPSIEKNLAPFWTLYSRERVGDAREDELLWGLFRYRRDAEAVRKLSLFPLFSWKNAAEEGGGRGWSFLLGLLGYERRGLRRRLKLLYFPFTFGKEAPKNDPPEVDENWEVAEQ